MQKPGVKPGFRIFVDGGRTADGQPSWRGAKATKAIRISLFRNADVEITWIAWPSLTAMTASWRGTCLK
jgi:hypothetical protein